MVTRSRTNALNQSFQSSCISSAADHGVGGRNLGTLENSPLVRPKKSVLAPQALEEGPIGHLRIEVQINAPVLLDGQQTD
jgi:hypothetical protein